ncbi:MAG TPA: hypothetical protein VFB27_13330 [Opitutaceae bacterium]|nr:hypothetical protein [Opitutaceae bacterium]
MKKQAWLWTVLAAGGLAAATALFFRAPNSPPPVLTPLTLLPPRAPTPVETAPLAAPAPGRSPSGPDYRAEIAALRRRGVAESSIQEIITKELLDHRRREQYRTELLIEQGRYAPHYWESPPSIETAADLERLRQSALAQLDQDTAGQLKDLFGTDAAPPPADAPLFGLDHPGPKIDFLPSASRQRLEETFFSRDPDGRMSSVDRLDLARQVLTPDEFELYAKWNSPAAASLGTELVGFGASQAEYDAIYRWQTVADSEEGFGSAQARTEADNQLQVALGSDRYAAFQHLQEPAYQTVVQMLNRWGLPASSADAVFSLRQSAVSAMAAIWEDPNVPDEQKAALVEKTRQQYRQQITTQLGLPPGLVPDDDLL